MPSARRVRTTKCIQGETRHHDVRASASAGDRAEHGGEGTMNLDAVDKIVNSVLYEGYMLYPYRRSSLKNQHRWTFGIVYREGLEPSQMTTECLVHGDDPSSVLKFASFSSMNRTRGSRRSNDASTAKTSVFTRLALTISKA